MDIFIEQLVKKNREAKDYLVIVGGIIAALLVVYILGSLMFAVPYVGFVIFIVVCGLIYLLYNLITSVNMEYEYAFTNGDFDVDAIINLKKRKMRMISRKVWKQVDWKKFRMRKSLKTKILKKMKNK